jgi:hypothetical protein
LAGHIFDINASYQMAFILLTALALAGLLLVAVLRPIQESGGQGR